jgi:hypothetical protein
MRERVERENVRIKRERESCNGSSCKSSIESSELSRVDVILILHVFIVSFLYL